jgi:hypothetical protein
VRGIPLSLLVGGVGEELRAQQFPCVEIEEVKYHHPGTMPAASALALDFDGVLVGHAAV